MRRLGVLTLLTALPFAIVAASRISRFDQSRAEPEHRRGIY